MTDTSLVKIVLFTLSLICFAVSFLGSNWLKAISRNPEAASKMFVPGIIALSCIEIASISCIGLIFLLIGK